MIDWPFPNIFIEIIISVLNVFCLLFFFLICCQRLGINWVVWAAYNGKEQWTLDDVESTYLAEVYVCTERMHRRARFDRFILFDRIKLWYELRGRGGGVESGGSQMKLYKNLRSNRWKKGCDPFNKYNWIPNKIDDYNTIRIRFFFLACLSFKSALSTVHIWSSRWNAAKPNAMDF